MTVHVSNAPDPRVAVPDVTGLRPAFAGKRVGAAGLVANFTGASQTKPTYVASQPPSAGQLVAKGSTVAMRLVAGSPP